MMTLYMVLNDFNFTFFCKKSTFAFALNANDILRSIHTTPISNLNGLSFQLYNIHNTYILYCYLFGTTSINSLIRFYGMNEP